MKLDEIMITEMLNNKEIKYFRYVDEYYARNTAHLNDDDFCVHLIIEIDPSTQTFKAYNTNEREPLVELYPYQFLLKPEVEVLNTKQFDEYFENKIEASRQFYGNYQAKEKQKESDCNKKKDANFARLNPPLKRGEEVTLVNVPRAWIDFTKKGDFFFIDDVNLIDDEFTYSLLVVSPRGKRGIYKFHTEMTFRDHHLKVK